MEKQNLLKQSVASVLLVSLLLQSCYNFNNSVVPTNNSSSEQEVKEKDSFALAEQDIVKGVPIGDRGAYGQVFKCKLNNHVNHDYALKEIDLKAIELKLEDRGYDEQQRMQKLQNIKTRELDILKTSNHPNIVRLAGYHIPQAQDKLMFVMDLYDDSLAGYLRNQKRENKWKDKELLLSPVATKQVAENVLEGLAYLHNRYIAHRDIKPENILVKKGGAHPTFHLTDFGVSKFIENPHDTVTITGTPTYMAPELYEAYFRKNEKSGQFNYFKADIYSFGNVLHDCITGKGPVGMNLALPTLNQEYNVLVDILKESTQESPEARPSCIGLLEKLKSDQYKNNNKLPAQSLSANNIQELQAHYQKSLRQQYLKLSTVEPLFGKPLKLENSHINLTIIQTEERKEKEKNESKQEDQESENKKELFKDERLSSFEDLFGEKRQISVEQLFDQITDKKGSEVTSESSKTTKSKHRFALVQGRAGIGKTTFSRYISHQWAKGQLWQKNYDWVFRIPLRELTQYHTVHKKANYTLEELVYHACFPNEAWSSFIDFWEQHLSTQAPERVLFTLDGYDEIGSITSDPKHLLYQPLHALIHSGRYAILLTTRPYGLSDLPNQRQNLEIMGFSHDNVEAYVKQYFSGLSQHSEEVNIRSQNLLAFLKQHPSVWSSAHIPINLNLLCGIHDKLGNQTSFGMSHLYSQLEDILLQRVWKLQNNNKKLPELAEAKRELFYQDYAKERSFLQRLAFQAMQQGSLIINQDLLKEVLNQVIPPTTNVKKNEHEKDAFIRRIHQIGLLKPTTEASAYVQENERDKPHEFMHLTFQEYFSAHYVAEGLLSADPTYRSEITHFIRTEKFNPQYQIIFWFVAGILQAYGQKLEAYLGLLQESATRDLLEDYQMGLLARCCEESYAADQAALQSTLIALQTYLKKQSKWVEQQHGWGDISMNLKTSHFFTMLSMSPHLHQQLGEWLSMDILNYINGDNNVKLNVSQFVALTQFVTPRILEALQAALKDKDDDVRRAAAYALGQLVKKTGTGEVIQALLAALKDKDFYVRSYAAEALEKMGEKVSSDEAINALVGALKDQDWEVCSSAAAPLGKMGEKAAIPAVIQALVGDLKDQDGRVRSSAAAALGKMKVSSDEAINALVGALKDQDGLVRRSAAEALWKMGEEAAIPAVIQALVGDLKDPDWRVRSSAAAALGKMKVSSDEVINALVGALKDQDNDVRMEAVSALVKLVEKTEKGEVIQALLAALKYKKSDVRRKVSEALGKLVEKTRTGEVIQALLAALKDKDDDVRRNAAYALGRLVKKTGTAEVIQALLAALKDKYFYVRWNAAYALVKLGEKSATTEVIQVLLAALKYKKSDVRNQAAKVLVKLVEKPATGEVIQALLAALKYKEPYVRRNAVEALIKFGEKTVTGEVIQALQAALKDKETYVRMKAVLALVKFGEKPATGEVIQVLLAALNNQEIYVRMKAASALGKLGEKTATGEVIQALLAALKDQDSYVRQKAAKALGNLVKKPVTGEVIQVLVAALKNQDGDVRSKAAYALGKLVGKTGTAEVVQALVAAMKDQKTYVHREVAPVLSRIEFTTMMKALIALRSGWVDQGVQLVIALAYTCMKSKAAMQIQAKQQSYNLVTFINKTHHVHTITPEQAQVLLHVLPVAVSMFMGLEPLDINHCEKIAQQLPPVNEDPLLQKLRIETVSETIHDTTKKPRQNINRNVIPTSVPVEVKPVMQVPPQNIASLPALQFSVSPIEALKGVLQAIVALGSLAITQEGKVVKIKLNANNNSVNAKAVLEALQQKLEEVLPELQFMDDCDIEGEQLLITMKTTLKAKQLKERLERSWKEVKES